MMVSSSAMQQAISRALSSFVVEEQCGRHSLGDVLQTWLMRSNVISPVRTIAVLRRHPDYHGNVRQAHG